MGEFNPKKGPKNLNGSKAVFRPTIALKNATFSISFSLRQLTHLFFSSTYPSYKKKQKTQLQIWDRTLQFPTWESDVLRAHPPTWPPYHDFPPCSIEYTSHPALNIGTGCKTWPAEFPNISIIFIGTRGKRRGNVMVCVSSRPSGCLSAIFY